MAQFVAEPGWHDHVMGIERDKQDQVSKDVLVDMRAGCPVDTGALLESLDEGRIDDTITRVGSRDLDYSVYVEEGHEIVYVDAAGRKVRTGRFVEPQPYMKPALYRERAL
jgi:hypothetical protein